MRAALLALCLPGSVAAIERNDGRPDFGTSVADGSHSR